MTKLTSRESADLGGDGDGGEGGKGDGGTGGEGEGGGGGGMGEEVRVTLEVRVETERVGLVKVGLAKVVMGTERLVGLGMVGWKDWKHEGMKA